MRQALPQDALSQPLASAKIWEPFFRF